MSEATAGDIPIHKSLDERIMPMLPDDLRDALLQARGRTGDGTIAVRIEAFELGGAMVPGLVTVERGGAVLQQGLLQGQQATDYLAALS